MIWEWIEKFIVIKREINVPHRFRALPFARLLDAECVICVNVEFSFISRFYVPRELVFLSVSRLIGFTNEYSDRRVKFFLLSFGSFQFQDLAVSHGHNDGGRMSVHSIFLPHNISSVPFRIFLR